MGEPCAATLAYAMLVSCITTWSLVIGLASIPGGQGERIDSPADESADTDRGAREAAPEPEADVFGDELDGEPWSTDETPEYVLRDSPEALRARHWVRGGIVMMSSGGALLVGAILMGASDPCNRAIGNSCQPEARNRAALAMGIPAAALLVGGASALGVGIGQRRQLGVDLRASAQGWGLTLRGRF